MEEHDEMSAIQIARMSEWLRMHGHTADEVLQCIDYIAGKRKEDKKEESDTAKVDRPSA